MGGGFLFFKKGHMVPIFLVLEVVWKCQEADLLQLRVIL